MPVPDTALGLDKEKIIKLIQSDGLLSRTLKGFEWRQQQEMMTSNVIDAFNHDKIALIEAGTGTGKSIAYLIPALLWASIHKERVVISTHTITLQEQLVNKDIPHLLDALNLKLKVALVKGMNNYVCKRKTEDAKMELRLYSPEEAIEFEKIEKWLPTSQEGSRSQLNFIPSMATWDRLGAESDACLLQECEFSESCYYLKARRFAGDAQILVVNHSLLLADLSKRADSNNYTEQAILPPYRKIILDEAHHIEEMATEYFASRLHRMELLRTLGRLSIDKANKPQGKLPMLKEKLQSFFNKTPPKEIAAIISKINTDLPAIRFQINDQIHEVFEAFEAFIDQMKLSSGRSNVEETSNEKKLRILPVHQTHPGWRDKVIPDATKLILMLQQYKQSIHGIEANLKVYDNDRLQEQTKSIRLDILALINKIDSTTLFLSSFLELMKDPNQVRWMEAQRLKTLTNIHLVDANLDVSESLVNHLFSKFPTIVLCSATLTSNRSFEFFRSRLGLTEKYLAKKPITENIYDSPFDYPKQALLLIPTDLPSPQDANFNLVAYEHIWKAIQTSRGNAFILFTSYQMLKNCYEVLGSRLEAAKYKVFKQGDSNRQELLNQFKQTNYSVLMGTDSFWEGVDVAGDSLRLVIIVKLPFKVPTEPIIQARTEAITAKGGDPFNEYSIPNAIVKFKQGFGRLIRNKWDRGCIMCLDNRLINKGYGKIFLNSLPDCEKYFGASDTLYPKMLDFYKKTYYLVKQNPFSNNYKQ